MSEVKVIINRRTGTAKIIGEGFETAPLKKALEGLGLVVERHAGHAHTHDESKAHVHQGA